MLYKVTMRICNALVGGDSGCVIFYGPTIANLFCTLYTMFASCTSYPSLPYAPVLSARTGASY
jgi:hypothetical protein